MFRLLFTSLILLNILYSQHLNKTENFRQEPNGKIIGCLEKNTRITILTKEGNWVKVRIEGYIWYPSISMKSNFDGTDYEKIIENAKRSLSKHDDMYYRKIKYTLNNPDFTKYSKKEFTIWAYMQSIWDKYEKIHGIKGAEKIVFNKAANKFYLNQSDVEHIFKKIEKQIFPY